MSTEAKDLLKSKEFKNYIEAFFEDKDLIDEEADDMVVYFMEKVGDDFGDIIYDIFLDKREELLLDI